MNTQPLRLLVVEDEAAHVEAIRRAFDAAADMAEIHAVGTLREYREMIAASPPDLALVDLNLPDGRAVEILTQPPENAPFPILVMTAFGNEQIVVEIMKAGALDYVVKSPEAFAAMPQTVARALREWRLIQQSQQASRFLFDSEEKHRRLIENIPDVVWRMDANRQAMFLSANALNILGHPPGEIYAATQRLWFDRIHPEDAEQVHTALAALFQTGTEYDAEYRLRQPDGSWRWLRDRATTVIQKQGIRYADGISSDITELKRTEETLHLALVEKTALVLEIHHRVKNNLAIMVSLINMQAYQIKHPEALAALADTKARLFSMSLLHEMLYSAGRMDQVEIQSYMQRLCGHISQSHGLSARGIQIQNSPSAPLTVGIDQAVPCGLIVSELVSNTIKHAFPNDRQGKVTVDIVLTAPDIVTLRVTDDGIGLPDGVQIDQIGKLGLSLVNALTHQLRGTLVIQRGLGTTFEIRFPLEPTTPALP